jgi:hypothetical protein
MSYDLFLHDVLMLLRSSYIRPEQRELRGVLKCLSSAVQHTMETVLKMAITGGADTFGIYVLDSTMAGWRLTRVTPWGVGKLIFLVPIFLTPDSHFLPFPICRRFFELRRLLPLPKIPYSLKLYNYHIHHFAWVISVLNCYLRAKRAFSGGFPERSGGVCAARFSDPFRANLI